MPKAFCGANRLGQVTQKLRALVTISQRYDVPVFISTNRVDAWQLPQLLELRSKCKLHESKHRWCALGIKAGNQMEPSAVIHRIASSCPISDTPCSCSPAIEHVYDVATVTASATHSRSAAEQEFVMFLLKTTLQPLVPSDWSSFDVSSSLRGICFSDEDGQRRILRKLHIRWWHISVQRLKAILHRVGIPKKTLDMIDGIVDTCRICRTWARLPSLGFQCFERQKRSEARNVIDVRWVFTWKIKQGKRFIRARLCIRGFKDTGSDQDVNTSPTATRFSQRLLVSETAARRWSLASTDIPKAFLQGISYAELAKETGREERQVSFELNGQPIFCLRQLPGFSDFNPASEVLRCTKPGTGCKDAPRAFNLKLKRVTAAFGFKPSIMDIELELWHDSKGELSMLLLKHVDDFKISGHKDDIEKLAQHLAKEFGKLDLECDNFTFCGVRHRQNPDGSIFLDQMSFISAIREMQLQPEHKALDVLPEEVRRQFLSLLMTVAYALLTRQT